MGETPKSPPMPSLKLTMVYFKGKELYPVMEQGNHQFLSDDSFVNSRAFHQFAWRKNIGKYEERCNKLKAEHLEIEDVAIQTQIKEEMIKEFEILTLEEGREMVRASRVLLLPNWDIVDALIFNFVSNEFETLDQDKKEIFGAKFSIDQATLVM